MKALHRASDKNCREVIERNSCHPEQSSCHQEQGSCHPGLEPWGPMSKGRSYPWNGPCYFSLFDSLLKGAPLFVNRKMEGVALAEPATNPRPEHIQGASQVVNNVSDDRRQPQHGAGL